MELTPKEKALLKNAGIDLATAGDLYHRHINSNGRQGALVHKDAQIEEGVFLGPKVVVNDHTHVRTGAALHGAAVFGPFAETRGATVVKGDVRVFGEKNHPSLLVGSTATGDGTEIFSSRLLASKASGGVSIHQSLLDHSIASGQDTRLDRSRMFNGGVITRGAQAFHTEISNHALLSDRSKASAHVTLSGKGTLARRTFLAHGSKLTRGAQASNATLNDGSWAHGPQTVIRNASLFNTEVNNSRVIDPPAPLVRTVIDDHRHDFVRSRRVEKPVKNPPRERILAR